MSLLMECSIHTENAYEVCIFFVSSYILGTEIHAPEEWRGTQVLDGRWTRKTQEANDAVVLAVQCVTVQRKMIKWAVSLQPNLEKRLPSISVSFSPGRFRGFFFSFGPIVMIEPVINCWSHLAPLKALDLGPVNNQRFSTDVFLLRHLREREDSFIFFKYRSTIYLPRLSHLLMSFFHFVFSFSSFRVFHQIALFPFFFFIRRSRELRTIWDQSQFHFGRGSLPFSSASLPIPRLGISRAVFSAAFSLQKRRWALDSLPDFFFDKRQSTRLLLLLPACLPVFFFFLELPLISVSEINSASPLPHHYLLISMACVYIRRPWLDSLGCISLFNQSVCAHLCISLSLSLFLTAAELPLGAHLGGVVAVVVVAADGIFRAGRTTQPSDDAHGFRHSPSPPPLFYRDYS